MNYSLKLRLQQSGDSFFGPGVVSLLHGIDETGGLKPAAARMDMAYSKAWRMLKFAEQELGFPLVKSRAGGKCGGGSCLTQEGREFLSRYEAFEREARRAVDEVFYKYF